jgi:hypothetical protein
MAISHTLQLTTAHTKSSQWTTSSPVLWYRLPTTDVPFPLRFPTVPVLQPQQFSANSHTIIFSTRLTPGWISLQHSRMWSLHKLRCCAINLPNYGLSLRTARKHRSSILPLLQAWLMQRLPNNAHCLQSYCLETVLLIEACLVVVA